MAKQRNAELKEFRRSYVPRLREAFNTNIKLVGDLIERAQSPEQASKYIHETERFLQDLADRRFIGFYYGLQNVRPEVTYREYETFGEAIKDFRDQSGMQINTLSLTSQVSSRTIVSLEKGRKSIGDCRSGVKARLANAFSVFPEEKLDDLLNLD